MFLVLLREQRWISKRFLSHINNLALSEQFLHLLANVSGKMCFKSAPQICIMKLPLCLLSGTATKVLYINDKQRC